MRDGTLRVWRRGSGGSVVDYQIFVGSPLEAAKIIKEKAEEELIDTSIIFNAFGLEVLEGGEWSEWYSDEGNDIREFADALGI